MLPGENCQFSLVLQGVKAPLSSEKNKPEAYGDESLLFSRYHYLQVRKGGAREE